MDRLSPLCAEGTTAGPVVECFVAVSPNQVPLPRYGMDKPVRVCNRCYIYYMNPYEERTVHAYHVYNGTGHGSWGYTSLVS